MKQTRKQEYDDYAVYGEFFCQTNSYGGIAIVVDVDGERALWRDCTSPREHTAQRWQPLKRTSCKNVERSRMYITIYGHRYYLDEFYRCA